MMAIKVLSSFEFGVLTGVPRHTGIVHWHEDRVRAYKADEKMPACQRFVHHPAEHFREPVIGGGKYAEDGRHTHNQVEMSGHESCVVQLNVKHRLRQEWAADSTANEERNESDGEQHGRRKPNPPTPKRTQPVKGIYGGRHTDGHVHTRES